MEFLRISRDFSGFIEIFLDILGFLWIFQDFSAFLGIPKGIISPAAVHYILTSFFSNEKNKHDFLILLKLFLSCK